MDIATGAIVQQVRDGSVLVLSMACPPVNALSRSLRESLFSALDQADHDPSVAAVVLASSLPSFSAGADFAEMDHAPANPLLPDLCARIEAMQKPVVAALRGPVLGGGLELALACHARIAAEASRLGFPEIALGLLPGAGGTQRLPRLIGAEQALRLILTGASVPAAEALALGMLDAVATGDPVIRAKELAREMAGQPLHRTCDRRDGLRDAAAHLAACATARRSVETGRLPAPARIVDCIEAAQLLPFEQGMAFERAAFLDLRATDEAAGLRRAFVAERRAQRIGAEWVWQGAAPDRLMVWGAAAGGAAKAVQVVRGALQAGLRVTFADPSRDAVVATLERIAAEQEEDVQRGRMTAAARDADWARLTPLVAPDRLSGVDAVILTRPDAPPVAQGIPVLAMWNDPPAGALGLALSGGPVWLAELAVPDGAVPDRVAAAFALAKRLRWRAVATRPGGPAAPRLAKALADCVALFEAQGTSRAAIAAALSAHGIAGEGKAAPPDPQRDAIARRCMGAMANEGARLLAEGVVRMPAAIDTIAIGAGLVARFTGGPMYQADRRGLLVLRRDLELWAADAPDLFSPAPLIGDCLSKGIGLCDLDHR